MKLSPKSIINSILSGLAIILVFGTSYLTFGVSFVLWCVFFVISAIYAGALYSLAIVERFANIVGDSLRNLRL